MQDGREGGAGSSNEQPRTRLALLVGGLGLILFLLDPYVAQLPSTLRHFWHLERYLRLGLTFGVEGMCLVTLALGVLHSRRAVRWAVIALLVSVCAGNVFSTVPGDWRVFP